MIRTCIALFVLATTSMFADTTFSMIKPGAVQDNEIGAILDQIESSNLRVVAMKMTRLSEETAKTFYKEHEGKPFFKDLVQKMTSGPVVVFVVEGKDAQSRLRTLVGATDPAKADPFTIRALFGKSASENAIHASD